MEINIRLSSSGMEEQLLHYNYCFTIYRLRLQTIWTNINSHLHTHHPCLTPERGGQSTTVFQGYRYPCKLSWTQAVFPLSLSFSNNFIKDLLSLKQLNSSLRVNHLHLQSTCRLIKWYKMRTASGVKWPVFINDYTQSMRFHIFCYGNFKFTTQIYRVDLQTLHDPMFQWCYSAFWARLCLQLTIKVSTSSCYFLLVHS